jgi:hypothetical protein
MKDSTIVPHEKPIYLKSHEAAELLRLVSTFGDKHRLANRLRYVITQLADDAARLAELEARARASGFDYNEPTGALLSEEQVQAQREKVRQRAEKRKQALSAQVQRLSPIQREELLKLLRS